jgi:hypothetical protein
MPNSGPAPGQVDYLVVAGGGEEEVGVVAEVEEVLEDIVLHFQEEQN